MRVFINFGTYELDEAEALGAEGIRDSVCDFPNLLEYADRFRGRRIAANPLLCAPGGTDQNYAYVLNRTSELFIALTSRLSPEEMARSVVEVFNEPTGSEGVKTGPGDMVTRAQYVSAIRFAYTQAVEMGYTGTIVAGGRLNLSEESMDWYRETVPQLPETVVVGYHGYPWGTQTEYKPWPPRKTWHDALEALRAIAGPRGIACTEEGMHTAEETEGFAVGPDGPDPDPFPDVTLPHKVRKTDEQVYAWWLDRLKFYQSEGLVHVGIYSWVDGNEDVAGARYGLHRVDGSRKPQAYAIRDFKEADMATNWRQVRVVGTTLTDPMTGDVYSLNPAMDPSGPGPWEPYHWEMRKPGTSLGYEQIAINGGLLNYNPTGKEAVTFGFQQTAAHTDGLSLVTKTPLPGSPTVTPIPE